METLDQLVETHLPKHAKRIQELVRESNPHGRLVLHDFVTRERVESTLAGKPIIHIGKDFALADLCYIRRDLEEQYGFLPSSIEASINPRIAPDKYTVFGFESDDAITLFVAHKERQAELERIPELHRLDDHETYRLFADKRDDIDPVTRLFSRTYLERKARNIYATDCQGNFYVIATDMDKFKRINKDFGPHKGDLALRIVGTEMAHSLGERGIASRRHYGDELLALVAKSFFQELPGGYEGWIERLNTRLEKRSSEIGSGVTLRVTAGIYDPSSGGNWNRAKIHADQALVFARTRRKQLSLWTPHTPTLDEMQSGRHTRYKDRSIAELQTDLQRAFPEGMTPEQAAYAQTVIDEHISKSEPIRNEGNRTVLQRLEAHTSIANPSGLKHITPQRVWESVYQTRNNLGLLTSEEQQLPREHIAAHLSQRFNLEHLFEGPNAEDYNRGLEAYGLCRYDDIIRTITASSESQALSRWIISGTDKPTEGSLREFKDLVTLLTLPYHFEGQGLLTLANDKTSTTISFDQERFDVAPRSRDLSSRTNRVINHLGLTGVMVAQIDSNEETPHYTFTTPDLAKLEPIIASVDDLFSAESQGKTRVYSVGKEYGVTIPHVHELLAKRVETDAAYAAALYQEPATRKNGTGKCRRPEITIERAIGLITRHYPSIHTREALPTVPVFHGPKDQIVRLLADLYLPHNIYLRARGDQFEIHNHRLADLDSPQATFDEVVTHCARDFHKLLSAGRVTFTIEKGRPILEHTPSYVGLKQFMLPIAHRYEELYCKHEQS